MLADVVTALEQENMPHGKVKGKKRVVDDARSLSVLSHLYPADCSSLMAAMKSIVTSFTDRQQDEESETEETNIRCTSVIFDLLTSNFSNIVCRSRIREAKSCCVVGQLRLKPTEGLVQSSR